MNRMKRIIILSCVVLGLLLSCKDQQSTAEQQQKNSKEKVSAVLKVAVTPTLDGLPLFVAHQKKLFLQHGLVVRLNMFQAQMDQDTALLGGSVDGAVTDLVRAERLQQHDSLPLHYLTSTNASWQMLTHKMTRIKSVHQMEDKMMAMTRYSATDLLADMVIDEAAVDSDKVFKIQINDVAIRLGMLKGGIMDAMFLPEPQATEARLLESTVLMDTEERNIRLGVIAFRKDLSDDTHRKGQLAAFAEAYNEACDSINKKGLNSYRDLIVEYCGTTKKVVEALPKSIHYGHVKAPREIDLNRAKTWLETINKKERR